jgi:hypothetical protein
MSINRSWNERAFGCQKTLTVKHRMLSIIRDELGLGRQPRIAKLLVDELFEVVDECYQSSQAVSPGQVVLLVPRKGMGSRYHQTLDQIPIVRVCVTLVCQEDIELLAAGRPPSEVRIAKLKRMINEAYDQGGTVTITQLAALTGMVYANVSRLLKEHRERTGELLPIRGVVEDIGGAVTHKVSIIKLYLQGLSTSKIARKTNHSPHSVERYITRFNQIRELLPYMGNDTDPQIIGRIIRCGPRLVRAYLDLIPEDEKKRRVERISSKE